MPFLPSNGFRGRCTDSIARPVPDPTGRWIIDDSISPADNSRRLWDPSALSGAKPVELRRGAPGLFCYTDFEPRGNWVAGATNQGHEVSFWPLSTTFAVTIDGWESSGFTRDGSWLVATDWNRKLGRDTKVRLWPVPGRNSDDAIDLMLPPQTGVIGHRVVVDPLGERALAVAYSPDVFLLSVHGGAPRNLFGFPPTDKISGAGFSPSGQLVAAASEVSNDQPTLRLWNLETDEIRVFDQPHDPAGMAGEYVVSLSFIDESTLYTSGGNGLIRWNMTDGTFEVIEKAPPGGMLALSTSSDRQTMLTYEIGSSFTRVANNVRYQGSEDGRGAIAVDSRGRLARIKPRRHGLGFRGARRYCSDRANRRGRAPPASRSYYLGLLSADHLARYEVDRLFRLELHTPPLAHARPLQAAAPHPAV